MSTETIDIEYWTEEYRKVRDVPGYLEEHYMRVKGPDGVLRKVSDGVGEELVLDIPLGLEMGCVNLELSRPSWPAEWQLRQQVINRFMGGRYRPSNTRRAHEATRNQVQGVGPQDGDHASGG